MLTEKTEALCLLLVAALWLLASCLGLDLSGDGWPSREGGP